jgi:hypothetical protein
LWLVDLLSPENLSRELNTKIIKSTTNGEIKNIYVFPPEFNDKLGELRQIISTEKIAGIDDIGKVEDVKVEHKKSEVKNSTQKKTTPTFFSGDDQTKNGVTDAVDGVRNETTIH